MSEPQEMTVPRGEARSLGIDVYRAREPGPRPCVILLHGGGWMFGSRKQVAGYAQALSAQGFTAIAAEYRLLGEAAWPAQIQDVKDVIAWVRTEAAMLGIDPAKIALEGFSAGGHLALLAAATPGIAANGETTPEGTTDVAAVVAFFAPAALKLPPPGAGPNPVVALLGPAGDAAAASPMTHISAEFPPVFLLHGTRDMVLPHQAAIEFFSALDRLGVSAELHLYAGQAHEFSVLPSLLAPVQAEVSQFLLRAMVDPDRYFQENETLNPFANGRMPGGPPPAFATPEAG